MAWRWNSRRHIRLGETGRWWRSVLVNPKPSRFGATFDPVHLNSIEPNGPGQIVISARHTDAIYGLDRSSGRSQELAGTAYAEVTAGCRRPGRRLFGGPHDARIDQNGYLTILDNGTGRPRLPRVVSYRLDLKTENCHLSRPAQRSLGDKQSLLRLGEAARRRWLARQLGRQSTGNRVRSRGAKRLPAASRRFDLPRRSGSAGCHDTS